MSTERIQRKRTSGWRMPEGAVYVGRPTVYGNPWHVERAPGRRAWMVVNAARHTLGSFYSPDRAAYWAAQGFRRDFDGDVEPLRGHDLACWCPLDQPCHADVLLELANREQG